MKAKIFAGLVAMSIASASAFAAPDVVTGVDQNGYTASVGTHRMVNVSHSAGVTYYKAADQYAQTFSVVDPSKSAHDKIVRSFGANAIAVGGVTWDVSKFNARCVSGDTQLTIDRDNGSPRYLGDGCALWQLTTNAGSAFN